VADASDVRQRFATEGSAEVAEEDQEERGAIGKVTDSCRNCHRIRVLLNRVAQLPVSSSQFKVELSV